MNDFLSAVVGLATDPAKGIVALAWLVMLNTILGAGVALLHKEFAVDKLLSFLGGERTLFGAVILAFCLAGMRIGLPLLPFYQFVAGAIAVSAAYDIGAKVVAIFPARTGAGGPQ